MIINKVKEYWTEEEKERLEEIRKEQSRLLDDLRERRTGIKDPLPEDAENPLDIWHKLEKESSNLYLNAEERYIKARKKKGLLADSREIIKAFSQEDFLERVNLNRKRLIDLRVEDENESLLEYLHRWAEESFDHCYFILSGALRVQLNGLSEDEEALEKVYSMIRARVSLWYKDYEEAYFPMVHGKPTDAFSYMSGKKAKINNISNTAIIEKKGVKAEVLNFDDINLNIGANKLLRVALGELTKQNNFKTAKHDKSKLNRVVVIPIKEYAQKLNYDVIEHEKNTPEEQAKEKKRAKNQMDNARRAIAKDLEALFNFRFSWEEKIKGKTKDFADIRLLTQKKIARGNIEIYFTPEITEYLADRNMITQSSNVLLGLDRRKTTAYYIGNKLTTHYFMDKNQTSGTSNILSVPKLLDITDLPTYEEVQKKDRGHWQNRIKEPFEEALETLRKEGLLKNWKYTHAKGVDLTDEEAENITTYNAFSKLYIHFILAETKDDTERIEEKEKRRKKQKEEALKKKETEKAKLKAKQELKEEAKRKKKKSEKEE